MQFSALQNPINFSFSLDTQAAIETLSAVAAGLVQDSIASLLTHTVSGTQPLVNAHVQVVRKARVHLQQGFQATQQVNDEFLAAARMMLRPLGRPRSGRLGPT